jgi:hypothetical protein
MIGSVWRPLLGALGTLLGRTSGEALIVQLLKVGVGPALACCLPPFIGIHPCSLP